MKKPLVFLVSLVVLASGAAARSADPDFSVFCSQLLQEKPALADYAARFAPEFRKAVSLEELLGIFAQLASETGRCESYTVGVQRPGRYQLTLSTAKRLQVVFNVNHDPSSGLFTGLSLDGIHDPSIQIGSWSELQQALDKLDPAGRLSAVLTTPDKSVNLVHHESEVFAIGSTFKLYVLGALESSIGRGEHRWDEILPLHEDWKSLPSGVMQSWPAGKEVKLSEYAEKMISISDNTAADHLIQLLGRENVEAMLAAMGNAHEAGYLPFLSTLEMFKLKWAIPPAETKAYLDSDRAARLARLEKLKQVPREAVGTNGVDASNPTLIDRLEWFATTPENCSAMFWLASRNSAPVRKALSLSTPGVPDAGQPESHWAFAGYKGGSEPGVINMTYLLESKKGSRACLAVSWNNPLANVSEYRFMDLVGKSLKLAEKLIP